MPEAATKKPQVTMAVIAHPKGKQDISPDAMARWRRIPAAVAADISQGKCLIDPAIRPLLPPGQQPRLFGRAVTAICQPPDFGAVLHALDLIEPGDVLVIDAKGHGAHAMIGEILGGHLRRKGATGIVCDGAVRDVCELAAWPELSVYARSITPLGPTALVQGEVNGRATIGGRSVGPGDLLLGDDDGLVSLNADDVVSLIDAAEEKLTLEAKWQAELAAGKSIRQVFGL